MTRFIALTDRLLPAVQEPCWQIDPTHRRSARRSTATASCRRTTAAFSQPQGRDPAWNTANCRNRRIFNDRTGLAAGQQAKPFLVQTYRRDMGGGTFALMKDISAPIRVKGRHWGGFRIGVKV